MACKINCKLIIALWTLSHTILIIMNMLNSWQSSLTTAFLYRNYATQSPTANRSSTVISISASSGQCYQLRIVVQSSSPCTLKRASQMRQVPLKVMVWKMVSVGLDRLGVIWIGIHSIYKEVSLGSQPLLLAPKLGSLDQTWVAQIQ